jgi:hypothetical protein
MGYYITDKSGYLDGKESLFKFEFFPHVTSRLNIIKKKAALGLIPCHLNAKHPSHNGSLLFF